MGGALLRFQWALLRETGYTPMLDADASTGKPLAEAPTYLFSPSLGGLVGDTGERGAGAWPVRAETVELLRSLNGAAAAAPPPGGPVVERANRLLAAYIRHVLGREPPTLPVVFGPDLPV